MVWGLEMSDLTVVSVVHVDLYVAFAVNLKLIMYYFAIFGAVNNGKL